MRCLVSRLFLVSMLFVLLPKCHPSYAQETPAEEQHHDDAQVKNLLRQKVDFEFEGGSLEELLTKFKKDVGVEVVVANDNLISREALQDAGLAEEDPFVPLLELIKNTIEEKDAKPKVPHDDDPHVDESDKGDPFGGGNADPFGDGDDGNADPFGDGEKEAPESTPVKPESPVLVFSGGLEPDKKILTRPEIGKYPKAFGRIPIRPNSFKATKFHLVFETMTSGVLDGTYSIKAGNLVVSAPFFRDYPAEGRFEDNGIDSKLPMQQSSIDVTEMIHRSSDFKKLVSRDSVLSGESLSGLVKRNVDQDAWVQETFWRDRRYEGRTNVNVIQQESKTIMLITAPESTIIKVEDFLKKLQPSLKSDSTDNDIVQKIYVIRRDEGNLAVDELPELIEEFIPDGEWDDKKMKLKSVAGNLLIRTTIASHRKIFLLLMRMDVLHQRKKKPPELPRRQQEGGLF